MSEYTAVDLGGEWHVSIYLPPGGLESSKFQAERYFLAKAGYPRSPISWEDTAPGVWSLLMDGRSTGIQVSRIPERKAK